MKYLEQPWFLAGGGIIGIFGLLTGVPLVLAVLIAMMVIDVVVGVALAWSNGELSSQKSFRGGVRKVIVLAIVLAAWLIQYMLSIYAFVHFAAYFGDIPANVPLAEFVGAYFIFYFFLSILENAHRAGITLPKPLANALAVGQEANE